MIASPTPEEEAMQQQILRVLAQHPAGLTPGALASQLGLTTSLTAVLRTMVQAGRVRRVTAEVYAVR
jgi:DNA-binding IclR family transcriptional regulator